MFAMRVTQHRRCEVLQRCFGSTNCIVTDKNHQRGQKIEWIGGTKLGGRSVLTYRRQYWYSSIANNTPTEALLSKRAEGIHQQQKQEPSHSLTNIDSFNQSSANEVSSNVEQRTYHRSSNSAKQITTQNKSFPLVNHPQEQIRSTSTNNAVKFRPETATILARSAEICDETIYPISSFAYEKSNYRKFTMVFHAIVTEAQRLVEQKYKLTKNTSTRGKEDKVGKSDCHETQISDTINLAFQLLLRISREPWKTPKDVVPLRRYYKSQFTNLLLDIWKAASLKNEPNLLSAYDMAQLVKEISHKHLYSHNHADQPRYDSTTIRMILQVAIHEARDDLTPSMGQQPMLSELTPAVFQEFTEFPSGESNSDVTHAQKLISKASSKKLILNLYNALMKAHAESNDSNVAATKRKMFDVIEEMRSMHFIIPDVITYNILLRYLRISDRTSMESFQCAFQMMQLDKIAPNMSTYNEVVQLYTTNTYANQQQLGIAEQYIKQMIEVILKVGPVRDDDESISYDVRTQYFSDMTLIANCAQSLMNAYVREFTKLSSTQQRQEIVNRAKALILLLDRDHIFSGTSTRKFGKRLSVSLSHLHNAHYCCF